MYNSITNMVPHNEILRLKIIPEVCSITEIILEYLCEIVYLLFLNGKKILSIVPFRFGYNDTRFLWAGE